MIPGVCRRCRAPVWWNGKVWKDQGRRQRHVCLIVKQALKAAAQTLQ